MATGNAVYETTFLKVDNRVYSKLAAAIDDDDTSLTVTLADAGLFPDTYPYILTLEDERVLVTNRVSNTLTITRAYDGTTAAAHAKKTYVALNIIARAISDLNAAVNTIEQAIVDGFVNIKVLGAADYPIDMYAATVNSGGADIRLSNAAKIDNTVAGTLKLMTTTSGYVSISEGQIIAKCDYLDLDLDVALRFIGTGKNIDGALVFRDNITIGRSGAPVNAYLYSTLDIKSDNTVDPKIRFVTTNTAHEFALYLDESQSHTELIIEGLTAGQAMVVDIVAIDGNAAQILLHSGTNYSSITHTASADHLTIRNHVAGGDIKLQPNNDANDYFTFTTASDIPTITATGATYMEIASVLYITSSSAVASHLVIAGTAKINSGEQAIYVNFPSETAANNGIWITLGSTVTSGDLTGIRSRVTGNATSAGATVRGAYLEAKVGASKYAAQLEGALIHADYSAGGATVSGDVRGLTVHISQGASLSAANLYGVLINVQTLGTETITTDDVGLLIRNEAVGGNGRTMDAALKITDLNMGGINGFYIGIDFTGITCTTAEIDLDFGKIIFDQDGDTDIHCDTDDELDFKLSGSNFLIMAAGVIRPGTTNEVDLGSSAKQFKDIYIDGKAYIDQLGEALDANGQAITAVGSLAISGYLIQGATGNGAGLWIEARAADNAGYLEFHGGLGATGAGAVFSMRGHAAGVTAGGIDLYTTNAAGDAIVSRLSISGATATAIATWANVEHAGLKLNNALTLNGQAFDAGSGSAQINTTGSAQGLTIKSTQAGNVGAYLNLRHDSSNPQVGDVVGLIYFLGEDDVSAIEYYSAISSVIVNKAAATTEAQLNFYTRLAGNSNLAMTLSGAGIVSPDHSIMFGQSQDLAAVADQVSLGGYEISAGHRALAIGCEELVITEGLTPDRSLPIRINGVTYKLMLVAV